MKTLAGKTLFITGGSRGIGREIALRAARDGAQVAIAAKTAEPHPTLAGTIHTVAAEIEKAGGKALALQLDVRDDAAIAAAIARAAERFGGIDILVNNASAISLTPTLATPAKRFDLMMSVNARATFLCSQACIPHLKKSANAHILNLSPPPAMKPKWFAGHVAYTMSKYGMSMCTLGMAEELKRDGELGYRNISDAAEASVFGALLKHVENRLGQLGDQIIAGRIDVSPFRMGQVTPCPNCEYRPVCRFDTLTNRYNHLTVLGREAVLDQIAQEAAHD